MDTIYDWIEEVLSIPTRVSTITGNFAAGLDPYTHNDMVDRRLNEAERLMAQKCSDPEFCIFDADALRAVLIASVKHENAFPLMRATGCYWNNVLSALPPEVAMQQAMDLLGQLADEANDEHKFSDLLRKSGYFINDTEGLQAKFAKSATHGFEHILIFLRFPETIPGKNAAVPISTVGGLNLQQTFIHTGMQDPEKGRRFHEQILDGYERLERSIIKGSRYCFDNTAIGASKRYLRDIETGKMIVMENRQTAEFLRDHLVKDSVGDYIAGFDGQFLVIAETNHDAKFTEKFWLNKDMFKSAFENGISYVGIETHYLHQETIDAYLDGEISRADCIEACTKKHIEIFQSLPSIRGKKTDKVQEAFANAYRHSNVEKFWEDHMDFIDLAKLEGLRVFFFDGWEGVHRDSGSMEPIKGKRTSFDHEWAKRITKFCGDKKAILRIGAAHEQLDTYLAQSGQVKRLLLCGHVATIFRQGDLSIGDGAIMASYPTMPVTNIPDGILAKPKKAPSVSKWLKEPIL